jgi:CHAD domain-containing protein
VLIGEPSRRLRHRQPDQLIDFVEAGKPTLDRLHQPVLDDFRPCSPVEVLDFAGEPAEHAPPAGLLLHLAKGALFGRLAGLELALGKRPVLMKGPVDDGDFPAPRRRGPHNDAPGGSYDRARNRRAGAIAELVVAASAGGSGVAHLAVAPVLITADDIPAGTPVGGTSSLTPVTAPDQQGSGVEVEWQLDAIDLRPVERWLAVRGAGPSGGATPRGGLLQPAGAGAEAPKQLLASVPGLEAVARPVKRLLDAYFDTPDWRLGRSGYVLRTRQRAGRFEATLKDLAPSTAGLRRRLEVTEQLVSADLAGLDPAGPVGRRVQPLIGARTLAQVLEVRTRRRPYALEVRGTPVGEVALDETVIVAGEERHPIRLKRVEVEVLPAWVESLSPLVERLRLDCGLQPATLSKFEAGLLGAGFVIPRPSDLGSTEISARSTVAEVAYAVLRKDAGAMLTHEAGTRLGEDIESLHQMRVATRRMRAALSLFRAVLPARATRVHEELGWLAGVLGAVRDLDIQLQNLDSWTEELPGAHRQALDELSDLLVQHHGNARVALLDALDSRRYERLVTALTSMLEQGPTRRASPSQVAALEALPELISQRHQEAEKAVRRAHRTGVVDDFHRLRIRCKRLRYAIEFTGDLYGGDVKRFARQVASLQDALGLIQDAETAANRLQDIALGEEGDALPRATLFAMGMVSQRRASEAAGRLAKLPPAKHFVSGKLWNKTLSTMEHRRDEAAAEAAERAAAEQPVAERPAAAQANDAAPVVGRARPALPSAGVPSTAPPAAGRPVVGVARANATSRSVGSGGRRPARRRPTAAATGGSGKPTGPTAEAADEAKTVTPIRRSSAPG